MGALLRGRLLEEAESYQDLDALESEFVRASRAAEEQAKREREEAQSARRLRRLAIALVMVIVLVVVAAIVAVRAERRAQTNANLATSRQLAAHAMANLDEDLQLSAVTGQVAREDNNNLASAGKQVVEALAQMQVNGWIDNQTAVRLAFKFLGEILTDEEIAEILGTAAARQVEENIPKDEETD